MIPPMVLGKGMMIDFTFNSSHLYRLPPMSYLVIRHASESWHPGKWNYPIELQLDSGFAGITCLLRDFDTVSMGRGEGEGE